MDDTRRVRRLGSLSVRFVAAGLVEAGSRECSVSHRELDSGTAAVRNPLLDLSQESASRPCPAHLWSNPHCDHVEQPRLRLVAVGRNDPDRLPSRSASSVVISSPDASPAAQPSHSPSANAASCASVAPNDEGSALSALERTLFTSAPSEARTRRTWISASIRSSLVPLDRPPQGKHLSLGRAF